MYKLPRTDAFNQFQLPLSCHVILVISRFCSALIFTEPLRRTEPTATALGAAARSKEVLDSWATDIPPLPDPTLEALKDFVEAKLRTHIPTLEYAQAVADTPAADVLAANNSNSNGGAQLTAELEGLRSSIWSERRLGQSEDTLHAFVENLILKPMYMLASHMNISLRMDRNSTDGSGATLKSLRPDVLVWLPSGVLAFKGEDKATVEDLQIATQELSTKLSVFSDTFFGSLRYQLCYALAGESLRFCAIIRNNIGGHELKILTDIVNLSTIRGRSLCVRYTVNITRLLVAMQRACPEGSVISLGSTVMSMSSEVSVLSDHVIKKVKLHTGWEVLKDLYALLERSRGVTGLIQVHKAPKLQRNTSTFTAYLEPVGICGKTPKDVAEVKSAGNRILEALQFLHSHSWVHRDIRNSNIMFAGGQWYLIDLEWANNADSELQGYRPNDSWVPPEILDTSSRWACASDMWQFGKLVETWGVADGDDLQSYLRLQLSGTPGTRLSAKDSLAHEFFKG